MNGKLTLGICRTLHLVRSLGLTLEAFRFERGVDNNGLASGCHRLGVSGALGHVRGADLSRSFSQHVETIKVLAIGKSVFTRLALLSSWGILGRIAIGQVREFVKSQQHALAVAEGNRLALLYQVIGQTVNATLRKNFATSFASVLVSVARVFQLRTPVEELEDQLVGFATHCGGVLARVLEKSHVSIRSIVKVSNQSEQ
jgi:hypothetical protein